MEFHNFITANLENLKQNKRIKLLDEGANSTDIISRISYLDCSNSNLTSIPDLPNCQILVCDNNKISFIHQLPECVFLSCNNNKILTIESIPKCRKLLCSNNKLFSLPYLPECEYIDCSNNEIDLIGEDLAQLKTLICNNNKITELPVAMLRCERLECKGNRIERRLPIVTKNCDISNIHEYKKPDIHQESGRRAPNGANG